MIFITLSQRTRIFNCVFKLCRKFNSKIPVSPVNSIQNPQKRPIVDKQTIALLERLSLVKCDTTEGVQVLEDSIAFADQILNINTNNIKPLYSVLENENLSLRSDSVTQGHCQKDILKNAAVTEEDYFVAPPGNIPLHEIETKDQITIQHQNEKQNI